MIEFVVLRFATAPQAFVRLVFKLSQAGDAKGFPFSTT